MSIYLGSFIIQILAFGILYWLLKKYAFGPLLSVMQKRQESIENQIQTAEKNRVDAEQYLKEQKEAIQAARQEAQQIVENAKTSSKKEAEEIVRSARDEAERLKEQAVQQIKHETDQAIAKLREQVGSLSVILASKIIEKELDEKAQSQLIEDFMKEVGDRL